MCSLNFTIFKSASVNQGIGDCYDCIRNLPVWRGAAMTQIKNALESSRAFLLFINRIGALRPAYPFDTPHGLLRVRLGRRRVLSLCQQGIFMAFSQYDLVTTPLNVRNQMLGYQTKIEKGRMLPHRHN